MKKLSLVFAAIGLLATLPVVSCKKETKQVDATNVNKSKGPLMKSKPIVIVAWDEWGRKRINCKGNGLCKAVWFPSTEESYFIHKAPVQFDEVQNKYYVQLLRESPVGYPVPDSIQNLPIDEPITLSTHSILGQDLVFPVGAYKFDATLGSYGGYTVYFN